MVSAKLLAIVALTARVAQAATPPSWEFTIPVNNTLNLTFLNNNNVNPPGELLPREGMCLYYLTSMVLLLFAVEAQLYRNHASVNRYSLRHTAYPHLL